NETGGGGLTIKEIEKLVRDTRSGILKPGYHRDGAVPGLFLNLKGGASWAFKYTDPVRRATSGPPAARELRLGPLGLGSLGLTGISLAEAREKAREARRLRLAGTDPIENDKSIERARALERRTTRTFAECRDEFLERFGPGWRRNTRMQN